MDPLIVETASQMRRWAQKQHQEGHKICLVPTMGALHAGHRALVDEAIKTRNKVVVSIFVNPAQFAQNEDLDTYPRTLEQDLGLLHGVDCVFLPQSTDIYPDDFDTFIRPQKRAQKLCGNTRPNHFQGVCTVVQILFNITRCDTAFFGEKDYQQLQIIRQMVEDLWLDVRIVGVPTVRDEDKLALSSRNKYLLAHERKSAQALPRALDAARELFDQGETRSSVVLEAIRSKLSCEPAIEIDYLKAIDPFTLEPLGALKKGTIFAAAITIGQTRLIDNLRI